MGLSKTNRIAILLVIDTAFFLLELIAGYSVHSLALVADSFHMLNDVISLLVGLWAVQIANRETSSKIYTYGWQRAEILGALVNGIFLIALCLSIFLEAIQRFVELQEVKNPEFICIIGCAGLLSNIIGLVLFHDHSHGGHGHSHEHYSESQSEGQATLGEITEPNAVYSRRQTLDSQHRSSRRYSTLSLPFEDTSGHPASMRQDIISVANSDQFPDLDDRFDSNVLENGAADSFGPTERSTLLEHNKGQSSNSDPHWDHSHSHDLNMRGVFLHVMGDALGNIGVILSALLIWLTNYSWRFYVDPGISLIITAIILASAIPLCKAASRILLQAVPYGVSIDHIMEDIERLPGIISTHNLHVWQLSDTKTIASIHVQVNTEIKGEGSERYMQLAKQVRQCLHAYGIHSSTIQPEFPRDNDTEHSHASSSSSQLGTSSSRTLSVRDEDPKACLLECGD